MGVACLLGSPLFAEEKLEFDSPDLAGMSGLRAHWDKPIPVSEEANVFSPDQGAGGTRVQKDAVVKERGQTAVWDGEKPGPLAFDAVHRNLLVRFPGAAEAISKALGEGKQIVRVELVLPYRDEEIWPPGGGDYPSGDGYRFRMNWDVDYFYRGQVRESTREKLPHLVYREERPNWHATAHVLRKPWTSGTEMGPTYNAAVKDAVFWKKFGASDEKEDRFSKAFGPTEVSSYKPEARMDVTAVVTDPEFGVTLGDRLRLLSDTGFLLSKWEVYDARYFQGAYEWAISSGPRAILIGKPKLVVTLEAGKGETPKLPPAANVAEVFAKHQENPDGKPTAVVPSREEVAALNQKFLARPVWMPEWQYQHARQLMSLGKAGTLQPFYYRVLPNHVAGNILGQAKKAKLNPEETDYAVYLAWLDWNHGRPPRYWEGHLTAADSITHWFNFRDAMPLPVQESVRTNWTAWLMPDRETAPTDKERKNFDDLSGKLIHPMADDPRVGVNAEGKPAEWNQGDTYYKKTGDWQGNKSYYRSGFTHMISTANFNSSAVTGALLNGQIIDSEKAIADGRSGLMRFPFWMWTYNSGVGQEYVDHYYWAIASASNKLVADFAEDPQDKAAGWSILQKTANDLAMSYHPNLKKLMGPASRTYYEHVLGQQDGLYHILHVLSKNGALSDVDTGTLPALTWPEADERGRKPKPVSAWGHDYTPEAVGLNSLSGPWADPWMTEWVDEKPLPWRVLAEKKVVASGDWVTTYFGENYGLSSIQKTPQRIHVLGQWRRKAERPQSMRDIGTLDMRIGFNETQIGNDLEGTISSQGKYRTYQHDNKLIMLAKPNPKAIAAQAGPRQFGQKKLPEQEIRSVQCSAALFNFEDPSPTWEIYVDDRKVESLPATAKFGQIITIRDGVTYLAFRPLPVPDLGRDAEVTLMAGKPQTQAYHETTNIQPALFINANYFYRPEGGGDKFDVKRLEGATGGFVVEMGDEKEDGSFEEFRERVRLSKLAVDVGKDRFEVTYQSGADTLVGAWNAGGDEETQMAAFTVNGKDPYADAKANAVWQDTTLSQMGLGRKLEKGGAVVERAEVKGTNPMMLQVFPKQKITVCSNPVPGYKAFRFRSPEGVRIEADGLSSMAQWVVKDGSDIQINYTPFAMKPENMPAEEARAKTLFISGVNGKPTVALNGRAIENLKSWKEGEDAGWLVALDGEFLADDALKDRFSRTKALIDAQ